MRKPWAHQQEALDKMVGKDAFALLCAMRVGKTKILVDDFMRLPLDNLLVIAPGGVYETWDDAIKLDASDVRVHIWRSGPTKAQLADLNDFMADTTGRRALVINIEALSSVKLAREVVVKFLQSGRSMVAVDESTTIKGVSAKRTKFVLRAIAPLAEYRRILSGLPTPQSPLDLYSQFAFLDWNILGYRSYWVFRARYAVLRTMRFGGRQFQAVVGYRNVEELWKMIEPWSYRKTLDEVYDLPEKMYKRRVVELSGEQRRIYRELKEKATSALSATEHVTATLVITQMLRLHQVLCGHVTDELGHIHEIMNHRVDALVELLGEYDGKAIIWASYDHDVRAISDRLTKEYGAGSVARFWGGNRATREEEERMFLDDPSCRFMVATPAAGGRGRTWTVASLVVYYSNTHDLEHRSQSEERAQGVGKADSVLYVDLVVPGTVDEKILAALRAKVVMAATITGDNYREYLT